MNFTSNLKAALKRACWAFSATLLFVTIDVTNALAQTTTGSPWENSANQMMLLFTGPVAKSLSAVAIVLGGFMLAFDTGHDKSVIARLLFGLGMSLSAVQFMGWLFGN